MIKQENRLELILVGAGGHAKSCIDVIELTNKYTIKGFLDVKKKVGGQVLGYPIIDIDENCAQYISENTYFLITIGHVKHSDLRKRIYEKLASYGAKFATIISPLAYIGKNVRIGEGTIVMHHALINVDAHVGNNCIINSKALIEHESSIQSHCHIATAAVINGNVEIGENSFVGSNSIIIQDQRLASNSFIKAGERVCG